MSTVEQIIYALQLLSGLVPTVSQIAQDVGATASLEDKAALDAAITKMKAAALADVATATADLDAAAKAS